jgi:hypothetical protein
MLRVIFDTNIYGLLIMEKKISSISKKILSDSNFKICGFKPIRKELRDTPKKEKLGKLNKRNLMLSLYDEITKGKYLRSSIKLNKLALKFYNNYRKNGGIRNWSKTNIDIDFTIVACACYYGLDVVISDDKKQCLANQLLKLINTFV